MSRIRRLIRGLIGLRTSFQNEVNFMSQKKVLSPTLFLILEFFILIPSIIFVIGVLQYLLFGSSYLMFLVTPNGATLQNIFVTIISPFIGGFFAYQYLERLKPKGFIETCAKGIIFYSIMLVGLVIFYQFFESVL